jgi:hypothetical protein
MMDEGEYDATKPVRNADRQNIVQYVPEIPEKPSAPPRTSPASPAPLPKPESPCITHIRQPPGDYRKPNDGEYTSSATTVTPKNVEHSSNHWALTAAEAEPTLHKALSGPDGPEWQEAVDYEISQLEKLRAWKVVTPLSTANIIPCHFILATKHRPDGEKLKFQV